MPAKSNVTTDHETIRRWVEERDGRPACVRSTGGDGDIGILRIDFPGYSGERSLEHIGWDEWFRKFDERNLAFLHQDRMADGTRSNFNKLIARETVSAPKHGRRRAGRRSLRSRSGRRAASRSQAKSRTRSARTTATRARGKKHASRKSRASAKRSSSRLSSSKKSSRSRSTRAARSSRSSGSRPRRGRRIKAVVIEVERRPRNRSRRSPSHHGRRAA